MGAEVFLKGMHASPKRVLCAFAYLIDCYVHLMKIINLLLLS